LLRSGSISGLFIPFTGVPACDLPVYASPGPLPYPTQDSVPDCGLGFVRVAISDDWTFCACKAQPPPHRTCSRVGRQRVTHLGTFPTAPFRTPRESFELTRLASDRCRDLPPRGSFTMDHLVALLAENQGLTPPRGHASDPEGFLPPPWSAQVGELTDVVHVAVLRGPAPFACLDKKALDHLTTTAVHLLWLVVEDGLLAPSQLDAAKPCHPWCLPTAPCVSGLQHWEGAVSRLHRRLVCPEDLTRAGAVFIREGVDQGKLHDP